MSTTATADGQATPAEQTSTGGSASPAALAAPAPSSLGRFFGNTWAITKKELNIYFTTPIAYVLFAIFLVILSYFFVVFLDQYRLVTAQSGSIPPEYLKQFNFTDMIFSPILSNAGVVLIFIVPFLTMRLIAEEKRQHTFQLLMTAPVRSWEIVLGKFLSSGVVMGTAIAMTVAYPLLLNSVAIEGGVDWRTAAVGYLGLFLLSMSFIAIGLFISSLTESQVVAAAVTFGILLLMWVLSWASQSAEGFNKTLLEYVCALTHLRSFLKGLLNLADVGYFLSVIVLGLWLTRTAIERDRW